MNLQKMYSMVKEYKSKNSDEREAFLREHNLTKQYMYNEAILASYIDRLELTCNGSREILFSQENISQSYVLALIRMDDTHRDSALKCISKGNIKEAKAIIDDFDLKNEPLRKCIVCGKLLPITKFELITRGNGRHNECFKCRGRIRLSHSSKKSIGLDSPREATKYDGNYFLEEIATAIDSFVTGVDRCFSLHDADIASMDNGNADECINKFNELKRRAKEWEEKIALLRKV